VLIYGHGFLGTHPQATRSSFNELCRRGAISAIGLNFGMYESLLPLIVKALNGEAEFFARIRGGVMQSMVNSSVAGRYLREALSERFPEFNPQDVQYLGISNGGTFGALFAATTHVVSKATLVVGGGGLSHFLQRASQWNDLGFIAKRNFRDPRELQLYLALLQEQLDPIDPINFVDRLISPRFEGRGPMRASLHMAVNDSQVHNLVSEWVARTAGVPLLTPSAKPIWGLEEVSAPLSDEDALALPSALVVYDEMLAPYPGGNIAPLEDNGGHGTIRQLESYQLNVLDFINEDKLNQHCEGPCDPN
jgi:pimeloyl-ACP methyl ester carboxylesterase